jgi:hypothetical protein
MSLISARSISLDSTFKVGENLPPPKKIAGEILAKNKNNFFGT